MTVPLPQKRRPCSRLHILCLLHYMCSVPRFFISPPSFVVASPPTLILIHQAVNYDSPAWTRVCVNRPADHNIRERKAAQQPTVAGGSFYSLQTSRLCRTSCYWTSSTSSDDTRGPRWSGVSVRARYLKRRRRWIDDCCCWLLATLTLATCFSTRLFDSGSLLAHQPRKSSRTHNYKRG